MTDIELIERIKGGDDSAFTLLFKRYQLSVTSVFTRNIKNKTDVDDLVMMVFIKVFRHINKYDGSSSFNAWITKITHNTLIDYYRQRKRLPKVMENIREDGDSYVENVALDSESPEDIYIKKQNHGELRELLKELNPEQHKIIELRFFKELQYSDIAKELNMPIGSVKAQIYRVKQILIKKLKEKQKKNGTPIDSYKE